MFSKALLVLTFFEFKMRVDSTIFFLIYKIIGPSKKIQMHFLPQFAQFYKIISVCTGD